MAELSKLQIRAKVLSVISKIKSLDSYGEDLVNVYTEELNDIEDKSALFDIFIKEFIKMPENEYLFSSCVLKNLMSNDLIQEKVFEILKSNNYSDDAKYKLVQLLRVAGTNSSYDAIPQYFDNPEEVLDQETQKLLETAAINPEAMLDFLDFVYAVPQNDKKLLIASLKEDYEGDVLANIIYPILYADFDDDLKLDVINVLAESKSSIALEPFEFLIKISKNKEITDACTLGLKKLRLAGASEEKAFQYFYNAIKDIKPAECYTTIPDGNGNQAIMLSRVSSTNKYVFEAVVINDNYGVVDCFGFYNISKNEFDKIVAKFYKNDGKYKVTPEYVKTRINHALSVSITNKRTLPYEFVCWNILVKDIPEMEKTIYEIINKKINKINTSKDDILELLTKDYTLRWFIKADEAEVIKKVTDELYKQDSITLKSLEESHNVIKTELFDNETEKIWKDKLYNLVYLLIENGEQKTADEFYALLCNDELFNLFKSILVQRSIFNHFVTLRETQKDSMLTVNIFRKRNSNDFEYDTKKLDKIINEIKKYWLDE